MFTDTIFNDTIFSDGLVSSGSGLLIAEFTLAHVTASLNGLATLLLLGAFMAIKQGKESTHKKLMYVAFGVSCAFLVVYLTRYALEGNKGFPREDYPTAAICYYILLISHVLLAITVPVFAIVSIYHGIRDNRKAHRKIVKFAFPIWLYVSVTGVVVYLMLYWIYVPKVVEGAS